MLAVIVNPMSGGGLGGRALQGVRTELQRRGLPFRVYETRGAGDAVRMAAGAFDEGAEGIVCIGGDGTIFEIVNGLAGRKTTLYFVPCGTGNDFVRMLALPKDPLEAFRVQLDGAPHDIDVGTVSGRYFLNVSGCGFDVDVLKEAGRFKRLGRGLLPYLFGLFAALRRFHPFDVEITCNGETYKGRSTIISVGNGAYFGGGMKPTPNARISDGLFELVRIDPVNRRKVIVLLSKFISGKHLSLPIAHATRCSEVVIRSKGMTVNLDGELIGMDCAEYKILPGALTVRAAEK